MTRFQKILSWILIPLACIAFLVSVYVIYYMATHKKPETIGTNYLTTLSAKDSDLNICTVNIYSNEKSSGQKLYEMQFNSFTDVEGKNVKGYGIQAVGDYSITNVKGRTYKRYYEFKKGDQTHFISNNVYTYQTDDNNLSSYSAPLPTELYVNIGEDYYKLNFNTFKFKVGDKAYAWWNTLFEDYNTYQAEYNLFDVFNYICQTSMSAKEDYEEFSIDCMDLSEFFTLLKLDKDSKQYKELPKTSSVYNYLKSRVNYSKNGALTVSDSLFKQVANSSSWAYFDQFDVKDYWNGSVVMTLNERNMTYMMSEHYNAYYVALDKTYADYLKSLTGVELSININLDNLDISVCGIDLSNFDGIVNKMTISTKRYTSLIVINSNNDSPKITAIGVALDYIGGANGN